MQNVPVKILYYSVHSFAQSPFDMYFILMCGFLTV